VSSPQAGGGQREQLSKAQAALAMSLLEVQHPKKEEAR
jgi:hypothetical protein